MNRRKIDWPFIEPHGEKTVTWRTTTTASIEDAFKDANRVLDRLVRENAADRVVEALVRRLPYTATDIRAAALKCREIDRMAESIVRLHIFAKHEGVATLAAAYDRLKAMAESK